MMLASVIASMEERETRILIRSCRLGVSADEVRALS